MIFDHIIETGEWLYELVTLLSGPDVFFVGLYCSLSDLERREMQRGDRHPGEARLDFQTVYSIPVYDLQINSENPPEENATQVIQSWRERGHPSAMDRMIAQMHARGIKKQPDHGEGMN